MRRTKHLADDVTLDAYIDTVKSFDIEDGGEVDPTNPTTSPSTT
jgi:hypothetical protein